MERAALGKYRVPRSKRGRHTGEDTKVSRSIGHTVPRFVWSARELSPEFEAESARTSMMSAWLSEMTWKAFAPLPVRHSVRTNGWSTNERAMTSVRVTTEGGHARARLPMIETLCRCAVEGWRVAEGWRRSAKIVEGGDTGRYGEMRGDTGGAPTCKCAMKMDTVVTYLRMDVSNLRTSTMYMLRPMTKQMPRRVTERIDLAMSSGVQFVHWSSWEASTSQSSPKALHVMGGRPEHVS